VLIKASGGTMLQMEKMTFMST